MKRIVAATVMVLVAVVVILLNNHKTVPKLFVANMTFETRSDLFYAYEITRYPTSVEVAPIKPEENVTVGVVVDPWNLKFGIVPAGNNFATRFVDLANLREKPAKVMFYVYGNISPFVNFSRSELLLEAGRNVTVEVKFYASRATIGNYTGEIQVVVQRPKYDFLYAFW
jgi:hypothetical protein